jgi:hypothetical protein
LKINRAGFEAQTNKMLGNTVMNPQQHHQKWMDKPVGDPSGLAYLKPLDFLLAKQVVSLTAGMSFDIDRLRQNFLFSSDSRGSNSGEIWDI